MATMFSISASVVTCCSLLVSDKSVKGDPQFGQQPSALSQSDLICPCQGRKNFSNTAVILNPLR